MAAQYSRGLNAHDSPEFRPEAVALAAELRFYPRRFRRRDGAYDDLKMQKPPCASGSASGEPERLALMTRR
jgi:hypothetical protein